MIGEASESLDSARGVMSNSKTLVPEARHGLEVFKTEVARELGVPFSDYNGDLSARQCGSVGEVGS